MRDSALSEADMHSKLATPPTAPLGYPQAARALLEEFAGNLWFLNSYWPENEPRVRLMARLALEQLPDSAARQTLDVGCANGYITYLFSLLGFEMSAVDAYDDRKRELLFEKRGIRYTL